MQANEIRQLLHEAPFQTFSIHMANGRKFVIDHPEIVAFSVDKRTLAVALRSGGFAHLDLRLATHTEPLKKASRDRKR
ncbi:MAG TPA: hypothetical protein VEO95_02650 [Chthoniobacteraceae bacterium]|nr:hypothetical protein [Chthoniobacteraceae bacterium]